MLKPILLPAHYMNNGKAHPALRDSETREIVWVGVEGHRYYTQARAAARPWAQRYNIVGTTSRPTESRPLYRPDGTYCGTEVRWY